MLKPFLLAALLLDIMACLLPAARQQAPAVPPGGLETPWDARQIVSNVQQETEELQPLLARMNPQDWVTSKGAPTTYIAQWQSAQQQLKNVSVVSRLFSKKTDSLSTGLDVYFRLEALEVVERSLEEGARQYDSRAVADKLSTLIARNFDGRQRLRQYLQDLAVSIEQDFKIADEEAQRCRGNLSKQTPTASKPPTASNRSKRK